MVVDIETRCEVRSTAVQSANLWLLPEAVKRATETLLPLRTAEVPAFADSSAIGLQLSHEGYPAVTGTATRRTTLEMYAKNAIVLTLI